MMRCMIPKEIIQLCRNDAGFVVNIGKCAGDIEARVHRSGAAWATDLMFTMSPAEQKNGVARFVMPNAFWEHPIGWYEADLYHGEQFLRTVRIGLNTSYNTSHAEKLESEHLCEDRPLPNTAPVTICDEPNICDPDPCEREIGIDMCGTEPLADTSAALKTHINRASIQTNHDLLGFLDDLILLLDDMLERGWYYSPRAPLSQEAIDLIVSLKELRNTADIEPVEAAHAVVALESELARLSGSIKSNMAESVRVATATTEVKLEPIKPTRIVKSQAQKIADLMAEATKK